MATTKMPAMPKLHTARMKLLFDHPFFASLLYSTPMVVKRTIWLASTDGRSLFVNPEACEERTVPELKTLLCHEGLHVAFMHVPLMLRLKLDRDLWNRATDYCINLILVEMGLTPIDGWLYEPQYAGLTALQIYDRLLQQQEESPDEGEGDAPGGIGTDLDMPEHGGDAAEVMKDMADVQQRVAQAAAAARMAGKMPGALERLIDQMLSPVVPWLSVLQDYMTRLAQDEETWRRRNRRFTHVVLPTRYSERMGPVIMIGDTSGSIGNDELCRYASETAAIAEQLQPEHIRVVWADTSVSSEQVFEPGDPLTFAPTGGGGTDMRVPLAHVAQYDPQVVILMTDGYTPWPAEATPYPLIVLCTTGTTIPSWAQVIRV